MNLSESFIREQLMTMHAKVI